MKTHQVKPALIDFTVNLRVLQLINMSLAQLIDLGLLFASPLGLTSSEHSGRLLGISRNYDEHERSGTMQKGKSVRQPVERDQADRLSELP